MKREPHRLSKNNVDIYNDGRIHRLMEENKVLKEKISELKDIEIKMSYMHDTFMNSFKS